MKFPPYGTQNQFGQENSRAEKYTSNHDRRTRKRLSKVP